MVQVHKHKQEEDLYMAKKQLSRKQHFILAFCMLSAAGLLISFALLSGRVLAAEEDDLTEPNGYETALINTYAKKIQLAITAYYQDDNVMAPSYTIRLKSVTAETKEGTQNTSAKIVFEAEPYVGPHNTVGIDELTFLASYNGDVTLIDYLHIDE
jgi:hypothetical protein